MANAQSKKLANLHVGTMGWSYSFWKSHFYPKDLPSKDFLAYYAKHLHTVEVDSTFYRIPSKQTIEDWKNQTPEGFLFSPKFPQRITHVKMLQNCEEETSVFLERTNLLGKKLGVLLLQVPPRFRQINLSLLKEYLQTLPHDNRYAVEVGNRSLFTMGLFELLKKHNISVAWVDSSKRPLTNQVTADFLYVRWEGNRKTVSGTLGKVETNRTADIHTWAERLKPLTQRGIPVFGYFSKYYSGYPVGDVEEFLQQSANADFR